MIGKEIKVIVGLGNPGPEHERDRHNIGYWLVDALAADAQARFKSEKRFHGETAAVELGGREIKLLKPTTYMNLSGRSLQSLMSYLRFEPAEILVVHDEIDLPVGTVRLKLGGGHGGHNGLRDLIRNIGADFLRLRIGVGHPGSKDEVTRYVLNWPRSEEQPVLDEAVCKAIAAVPTLLRHGLNRAQGQLHSKPKKADTEENTKPDGN